MAASYTGSVRVDHTTAFGTFSLDGGIFDVENNVWVVGDDDECVVIDAPHSVDAVLAAVGGRKVKAILLTHAHDDHCRIAPELREAVSAPIHLHPADRPLWELVHEEAHWNHDLYDGQRIPVGDVVLTALHTPGHAPGATCFHVEALGCVFTGDTLFHGGPGATGRSYSDRVVLEESIWKRLFALSGETTVHTGHGQDTTLAQEKARMSAEAAFRSRGHRLPGEEAVP